MGMGMGMDLVIIVFLAGMGWVLFLVVCSRVSGLEFKSRFDVVVGVSSGYVVWVECLMMMKRKNGKIGVQAIGSRI